ncbi:LacI family DNA-binding transcriptional regulator [Marinisporobacter balticus]|uniref:LacI family transcriptional regulator n=1 Tax=Marinisporobacter balticus TaxID=2018667 RepID=A0A4R2KD32_9FIRM|nr:LacI family DNA-binding transcriptional regulator [Marinisporobacter balticus]TCO70027.1 LacI family transcriptional regulator [Marinisporobacter balticus]
MITIKDIAKEIGISYTTVSRALNGKSGVSPKTVKKVLKEAEKMGYQPNAIARGLVKKYTNTVGLVIADITNPYYPSIARGVEDAARKIGYNVFLCNTNYDKDNEKSYLKTLQEQRVDGIIIHPAKDDLPSIYDLQTPMILINRPSHGGKTSTIEVDNERGGFLATEHLIQSGYKRISFIGGDVVSYSNNKRLEGYKQALMKYNQLIDESMIVHGSFKTKSGYTIMEKMLKLENPPDAVFAGNDVIALGVLHCAQDYGLNMPDAFGVVGFDNVQFSELPQIQLTTIDQPKYYIGKLAFEMLIEEIRNKEERIIKKIVLEPELIIRKTTQKR